MNTSISTGCVRTSTMSRLFVSCPACTAFFDAKCDGQSIKMDSAEDLRTSTVASGKRLAIVHSSLHAKFSLHLQGGSRRIARPGNKVIGEMVRFFSFLFVGGGGGTVQHGSERVRKEAYSFFNRCDGLKPFDWSGCCFAQSVVQAENKAHALTHP